MKNKFSLIHLLLRYHAWIERRHSVVLVLSLLVAVVGTFYSVKLYKNLRTDMEELLPETAQSVKDLKAVQGRVGGLNHLSVVIESQDVEAGRKFQRDLAQKMRELPKSLVDRVADNIQEEKNFFSSHKALYMDLDDWERVRKYVKARLRSEGKKNPFSLGLEENKPGDRALDLDFEELRKKYADRSSSFDRFPGGYFESRDGKIHVVLAFLAGKVSDIENNKRLSEAAHRIARELDPKRYAPDMEVGFSGDVQNVVEEHYGLVKDLILSSVIVAVLVLAVLLLYFRSIVGVLALSFALYVGTAATFGLSYWTVGYLNANSAFLGSIIIGNGINFGIIMLARYLEERRRGLDGTQALPRAVGFTAQATWAAALAAGFAYGSLVVTNFRGFNQFGVIGGMGMVVCWIASFTTLPALLIWLEQRAWIRPRMGEVRPWIAGRLGSFVILAHRGIAFTTVVSVLVAGILITRLSEDTLESDFRKLRNKESLVKGSGYWGNKVDAVFERYLTPSLILTFDSKDTGKLVQALKEIQARAGGASPISDIKRVEDFLPKDQFRKIRIIEDLQELVRPSMRARLSKEERELVDEFLPEKPIAPIELEDLPEGVVAHFRELDGSIGRIVHVYPKLALPPMGAAEEEKKELAGFWDGKEVIRFAESMRQGLKDAAVSAAIAGQPPLSADMLSAIVEDGPKATLIAFLAVVILIILLFPKFEYWRSILGALLLGIVWLGALMAAFDLKVNFLNFIALPITFGIGVDYAVNIFSRYRSDGSKSIAKVIEHTGGAVGLCSLTTMIGYSSLLIAGSQAFVSFGTLAVLGELTCVVAAVISVPAIWHFFEEGEESVLEEEGALPTGKG
ncbi:MAG: MMPL family transporter [Bdellovibrionota bacterium]